jgi:hypothetical protein
MRVILWGLLIAVVVLLAYIRLAPSDPQRWDVDPLRAEAPDGSGWLVRPDGGNASAGLYQCGPEALLEALDRIALSTPRTKRLTGSVAEGQITYVTRSRVFGFPDYTTITTLEDQGGARPVLHARLRFGQKDMGVNRARVESWLARLDSWPDCPRPA